MQRFERRFVRLGMGARQFCQNLYVAKGFKPTLARRLTTPSPWPDFHVVTVDTSHKFVAYATTTQSAHFPHAVERGSHAAAFEATADDVCACAFDASRGDGETAISIAGIIHVLFVFEQILTTDFDASNCLKELTTASSSPFFNFAFNSSCFAAIVRLADFVDLLRCMKEVQDHGRSREQTISHSIDPGCPVANHRLSIGAVIVVLVGSVRNSV